MNDGVLLFRNGRPVKFDADDGAPLRRVVHVNEDRDGNIWLATSGGGLFRYNDEGFSSITAHQGLNDNTLFFTFEDSEGSLWIGTETGGVNRLRDTRFLFYSNRDGLPIDTIRTVTEDTSGNMWFGSDDGALVSFDGQEFFDYRGVEGFESNGISSLLGDSRGGLWIGNHKNGLLFYDGRDFRKFEKVNGAPESMIRSLYEDRSGRIWIGTVGDRVFVFHENKFKSIPLPDTSRKDNMVLDFLDDGEGSVWMGTVYSGLLRYDGEKFHRSDSGPDRMRDPILALHLESSGAIWGATSGSGIFRLRNDRFCWISSKDGLYSDTVFSIREDKKGYFWFSGNTGLSRISLNQLNDFCEGRRRKVSMEVFGLSDGMVSREFNGGSQPSSWKDRLGKLWFPSLKSVVVVDPLKMRKNRVSPPVVIENFKVDGKDFYSKNGELKVPSGSDKLEIGYTAPSFIDPERMRFRYRLDGYDNRWMDSTSERKAYYMNLPPGHYSFRVMAVNRDNVWSEDEGRVDFFIEHAFYETAFFRAGLATILLALLYSLIRLRFRLKMRSIERNNEELKRLVEERTREIREMSLSDALTGLRNRRYIREIVKNEGYFGIGMHRRKDCDYRRLSDSKSSGIFYIDLDHFKSVNDTYGHDAGDEVLKQFSGILKESVRKNDVVIRWGGEEFLVILRETDPSYVPLFAEELREKVESAHFKLSNGRTIRRTCSIGYLVSPFYSEYPDLLTFEQAVALADLGLYHAKTHGRNMTVIVKAGGTVPLDPGDRMQMVASHTFGPERDFFSISITGKGFI